MARTIVSTQIIEWKFEDKVSQSLNKVEDSLKKVKTIAEANGFSTFSKKMDEAKTSADKLTDSTSKIGKTDNLDKATTRVEKYAKKVKETPKERMTRYRDNLATQTSKIAGFIKKIASIPKTIKSYVQLNSESATTRMEKYHRKIRRLPKNVLTQLKTHIDQGADKFKRSISQIPRKVKTFLKTNSDQERPKVDQFGFSLKNILKISGLVSVAQKGLSMVTNSLGAAFQRSDAIYNYGKTLKILGFTSDEATKSQKRLTEMVNGTAFGLDQASRSTKTFVATGRSLKESEDMTKSLMKAVTVFGDGSKDAFDQVSIAMGKMAGSSKANMQDIYSLTDQAPGILQKVAGSLGKSMEQLQDDLGKGRVSSKEFLEALQKTANGYSDTLIKGNDTWQKVFDNSKAKLAIGLANVVDTASSKLDKAFNGNSKDTIVKFFDGFGKGLERVGNQLVDVIVQAKPFITVFMNIGKTMISGPVEAFKKFFSKLGKVNREVNKNKLLSLLKNIAKHKDTLKALGTSIVVATAAFKGFNVVMKITNALMNTSPWMLVVKGIILLVAALIGLYTHNKTFQKVIDGIVDSVKSFFKAVAEKIGNAWKFLQKVGKAISKGWKSFWKGVSKTAQSFIDSVGKLFSKLGKAFDKYLLKPIEKVLKVIGKVFLYTFAFIAGVLISIFEKPVKQVIKLLTKFAKSISKLWTSLSKTTHKIFTGIGKSITNTWRNVSKTTSKTWNGIIKSLSKMFNNLSKSVIRTFNGIYNTIKGKFETVWKFIQGIWTRIFHTISDFLSKILRKISQVFSSIFETIRNIFNAIWTFFRDIWNSIYSVAESAVHRLSGVISRVVKSISDNWSRAWNGIKDVFGQVWKGMKDLASDGINVVITYVNKGIGGINGVIHAFGGKKETIAEIKPVKLAQGTRSHRGGFAMLNDDGTPDPREIAILPSGKMIMPQERNVVMPLPQGTEVLNSRETKEFLGGTIPKYAEGTGIWDMMKGMFKWTEDKVKAIADFVGHPVESLTKVWDKIAEKLLPKSKVFNEFAFRGGRKILSSGKDWFKKIFEDLKGKLETDIGGGGGSRGEFVKHVLAQQGKQYVWGGEGPNVFDCSGLIKWALKQVGIEFPHYTGAQWEATDHINEKDARPGDLVYFGPGASRHVGMFTKPGEMFNASSPDAYGPGNGIGYSPYAAPDLLGFARIRQLTDGGGASDKFGGNWAQAIKVAAEKMRVSITDNDIRNILSLIQHESGGNEKVTQSSAVWDVNTASGNPAKGLLQYIPQTFAAYAMPGHTNIFSGYDQLLAFFNNTRWRSEFTPMGGWSPNGPRRFALGGHVTEPTMALIGEHNGEDEYIINPHQPTAHGLLQEAALKAGYKFNSNETNSLPAELIAYLKEIILALRENKKVYIDVGSHLVEVTDKQLGDKQQKNDRLFLGGGRTDGE